MKNDTATTIGQEENSASTAKSSSRKGRAFSERASTAGARRRKTPTQKTRKTAVSFSSGLVEKAELVSRRMIELREALDKTVFTGISDDGIVEIGLCGDGRPASAEIHVEGQDEEKQRLAFDILDALDNIYAARIEHLENGLKAIQDESGVGPDFEMPF